MGRDTQSFCYWTSSALLGCHHHHCHAYHHRAPNDTPFARLWRTRTEIHPLQVCPVRGIDPLNWPVRDVSLLSKILHSASVWKSGNEFLLARQRQHSCDLGKSVMLSAQLFTLCFQPLWSSGSENYNIVRICVHYTLQSKSKYYIQNKILSLHSGLVKGWQLWTQSDTLSVDEEGVKTLSKISPQKRGGGEGTPWKDSKLGALHYQRCRRFRRHHDLILLLFFLNIIMHCH